MNTPSYRKPPPPPLEKPKAPPIRIVNEGYCDLDKILMIVIIGIIYLFIFFYCLVFIGVK